MPRLKNALNTMLWKIRREKENLPLSFTEQASMMKHFLEDDTYSFAKESPKWEVFKEKWTS